MGLAGGLAGGAAIGALLYGSSRISKGREAYVGGIPDRMKLMGRGVDDMQLNDRLGAAQAGLNAQSMRAARLRYIDVFGREGASQESVTRRARFKRWNR